MSDLSMEQAGEDEIPAEYLAFVESRLDAGETPGDIQDSFRNALLKLATKRDWRLHGDDLWRRDTVCPVCGWWAAGICGCERTEKPILYSEYLARQAQKAGDISAGDTPDERG